MAASMEPTPRVHGPDEAELLERAAAAVGDRFATCTPPSLALVTGSGLGELAHLGQEVATMAFSEIPGLAGGSVQGHPGRWSLRRMDGVNVYCLAGRRHLYEGLSADRVVLPVRVLARLGCQRLILTNAAGGLSDRFVPGNLMLLSDHLDLTWRRPSGLPTRPDRMGRPASIYCPAMNACLREVALQGHRELRSGIYAGVLGPTFETPAEAQMLARMGADAVGMSTVLEAQAARLEGLHVAAVSIITNTHRAHARRTTHAEVLATAARAAADLTALIGRALPVLGGLPNTSARHDTRSQND